MFDFYSKLPLLKEIRKPGDIIQSEILQEESSPLYCENISPALCNQTMPASTVIFKPVKNVKKNVKTMWDVDIKHTGPGYFDQEGNFILDRPKKIQNSWIIQNNNKIEGPFTDKELKQIIEAEEKTHFEGINIKREFDKGFVPLKNLLEDIPNLFDSSTGAPKELNKYFSKHQKIEESAKSDDFFEPSIVAEKNTRLSNFIRNHDISASVDFVIKTIKNMRKSQAIDAVQNITGLDKTINSAFVDLIIESAGFQILSDVDKDGFYINDREDRRRKR